MPTYKVRDIADGSPDEWSEVEAASPDLAAADAVEEWDIDGDQPVLFDGETVRVEVLDELTGTKRVYVVTGTMVPTYWAKEVPNEV